MPPVPPTSAAFAQDIEAKREEKPLPEAPEPEQPAQVLDLAALEASVQQARASRGEEAGPAEVHEPPKPRKEAATTKQPAKEFAAKQTAAEKSTGCRPRSA